MNDETQVARVENPFAIAADPQAGGSIAVEQSRAIAEVMASMHIARHFPRDPRRATDLILTDCTMPSLAEDATYGYVRGGSDISGPSIRLAETIARRWGNIQCGVKELGRREGYSEVMAYAMDLETGFKDEKTFQVKHWRDTKKGGYVLTDERDIYETIANSGARRKRACILAVIPQDVVDAAVRQCEVTLKQKIEITPDFIRSLVESFDKFGVTQEMIEKRIQRRIDALTPAMAVQLRRIHNSLRDGMGVVQDWFDVPGTGRQQAEGDQKSATDRTAELVAQRRAAAAAAKEQGATPPEEKGGSTPPQSQRSGETGAGSTPGKVSGETKARPAQVDSASAESGAPGVDKETGEITVASVREAIRSAGAQQQLTALMGDMMKLPAGPERDDTIKLWNTRVIQLKGGPATAKEEEKPAEKAPAKPARAARPHGTAKVKGELIAKMNKAKDIDALNEAANEISLYAWDEVDKEELEARYHQCAEDLNL